MLLHTGQMLPRKLPAIENGSMSLETGAEHLLEACVIAEATDPSQGTCLQQHPNLQYQN